MLVRARETGDLDILSDVDTVPDWPAWMLNHQFDALLVKLRADRLVKDLASLPSMSRPSASRECDLGNVRKWLLNGWSTERLLRLNCTVFEGDDRAYALHWGLAQAYYSVFALSVACFKVRGWKQEGHAQVIKLLGERVGRGDYPESLSFYASGGMNNIICHNIDRLCGKPSLAYDASEPCSVDNQIAQFLRATREIDLKQRRQDMRGEFRTKRGNKVKQSLTADEWGRISDRLGNTTVFSLLYRNRIRANYGDIETYFSQDLNVDCVFDSLVNVVNCLNLVHEAMMMRALGKKEFEPLRPNAAEYSFVVDRCNAVASLSE